MARSSSPSSKVTWPSAAMQAATAAITCRLTLGLDSPNFGQGGVELRKRALRQRQHRDLLRQRSAPA